MDNTRKYLKSASKIYFWKVDWPLASVSTQFEFFQILSCFIRSAVCSHLFDKRFCRISAIMRSFFEKFIFVWESADLVMSWQAPCLPKMKEITPPLFLPDSFSLLPPKNQIFRWTSIIKLKVTKFLIKLSQFKFLVKQIKTFLFINFFCL